MDAPTMVAGAIWLFGIAALGGLVMLFQVFTGRERPWSWLAMLHGFLAAAGITLVVWATVMGSVAGQVNTGLVILLFAAMGGGYLALKYHVKMLPLNKPVVLAHAALAVTGFVLVLLGNRGV